jgi:hypothetical protein
VFDPAFPQIIQATGWVQQIPGWLFSSHLFELHCHGIDGEIPQPQILFNGRNPSPKGRKIDLLSTPDQANRFIVRSREIDEGSSAEFALQLFRTCQSPPGNGKVQVMRNPAQQTIANSASHEVHPRTVLSGSPQQSLQQFGRIAFTTFR